MGGYILEYVTASWGCLTMYFVHTLCVIAVVPLDRGSDSPPRTEFLRRPPAAVTAPKSKAVRWLSSSRSENEGVTESSPTDASPTYVYTH